MKADLWPREDDPDIHVGTGEFQGRPLHFRLERETLVMTITDAANGRVFAQGLTNAEEQSGRRTTSPEDRPYTARAPHSSPSISLKIPEGAERHV